MRYSEQLTQIAEELNIPLEVVKEVYLSFWRFVKQKIGELPLNEDLSEEEFKKLRTSFNIPSLGKLSCGYERMKRVKESKKYIRRNKNGEL